MPRDVSRIDKWVNPAFYFVDKGKQKRYSKAKKKDRGGEWLKIQRNAYW
jgi:hypothetical protein